MKSGLSSYIFSFFAFLFFPLVFSPFSIIAKISSSNSFLSWGLLILLLLFIFICSFSSSKLISSLYLAQGPANFDDFGSFEISLVCFNFFLNFLEFSFFEESIVLSLLFKLLL
jgi:hypothetical protein